MFQYIHQVRHCLDAKGSHSLLHLVPTAASRSVQERAKRHTFVTWLRNATEPDRTSEDSSQNTAWDGDFFKHGVDGVIAARWRSFKRKSGARLNHHHHLPHHPTPRSNAWRVVRGVLLRCEDKA